MIDELRQEKLLKFETRNKNCTGFTRPRLCNSVSHGALTYIFSHESEGNEVIKGTSDSLSHFSAS